MIPYDPKSWTQPFVDAPRTAVFRRIALSVAAAGAWAWLVAWLSVGGQRLAVPLGPSILTVLGTILGLLLTFRTNTAYDRWWEGRRLWGQLINATRALAHHLDGLLAAHLAAGGAAEPGDDAPASRRERYAALLGEFAAGLAAHLRRPRRAPGAAPGVAGPEGRAPNAVVRELARRVHADVAAGVLPREATLVLAPLLGTLDDVTGGCERIRNTPIPASYGAYLKFFVLLYTLALPFGLVRDFGYGAVPATMLVLFATAGVELLAEEIENPFGADRNDLPIDELAARAATDARELLGGR